MSIELKLNVTRILSFPISPFVLFVFLLRAKRQWTPSSASPVPPITEVAPLGAASERQGNFNKNDRHTDQYLACHPACKR